MRILVIEDEKKIAGFIERGLKEQHYAVDLAADGDNGCYMAEVNPYDLIILDIMLPGKDGIEVCKDLRRKKSHIPILMLTARSRVKDKVEGLHAGADDYLAKPFEFEELLARIQALLRRQRLDKTTVLKAADLELNPLTHEVKRAGTVISMSSKEYALLQYFMRHANQIVTRTMISEHVWNEAFDTDTNVIDVYVNYLRNKIDKDFDSPLIHTVRGTGYMLSQEKRC